MILDPPDAEGGRRVRCDGEILGRVLGPADLLEPARRTTGASRPGRPAHRRPSARDDITRTAWIKGHVLARRTRDGTEPHKQGRLY